ncbi:hypothetical protein EDB85DRAFT_1890085 [Lactarius pseudohatsudake]|nr:hypothetical protein EDB85DRAFT_1899786 [Lactarius pseudohatsudake]KAH9033809.1 hypothetical protein EDB85DRAFT_1890085 [Lactarius pseudohatsudake]
MPPPQDPNLNVTEGPRKRRPTERVTENGDPLAGKRRRLTSGNRRAPVDDAPEPTHRPRPKPVRPQQTQKTADNSNNEPVDLQRVRETADSSSDEANPDRPRAETVNDSDNSDKDEEPIQEVEPEDDEDELAAY